MKSNHPNHPAQSSASSPRRRCCHPFEDFIGYCERRRPADFKHHSEEDWNFIRNEIKAESSSSFDSSAVKNNYYPHLIVPRRLSSAQTTQKNSSSHPSGNKNPVVPFLAAEQHHVPSFHPIADADATAIPIDLLRGISDYDLLMEPFICPWGSNHYEALDPTPIQEQGTRIIKQEQQEQEQEQEHLTQQQKDEIDLLLLESTFLPEDREPVSYTRRVSVLKRQCDEDGYDTPEQQQSDTKEEAITSILEYYPVTPSPSKKPRLICPSPDSKSMEQSDDILRLLSTKKTSYKKNKNKNKKLSATRKLSSDGTSLSDKKVASSSSKATVAAPKKKDFTPKNRFRHQHTSNWMDHLREAAEYQKKNGHCAIPHEYPPNQQLARWAKRQRYQYKRYQCGKQSSMTNERVQALETLDFCWDAHKKTWSARYEQLRQFNMVHGHSNVPSNYAADKKLATWVKCQRRQYKLSSNGQHSNIFPGRIELLDKLDFVWDWIRVDLVKKEEKK
jgi:hypothetical protein